MNDTIELIDILNSEKCVQQGCTVCTTGVYSVYNKGVQCVQQGCTVCTKKVSFFRRSYVCFKLNSSFFLFNNFI